MKNTKHPNNFTPVHKEKSILHITNPNTSTWDTFVYMLLNFWYHHPHPQAREQRLLRPLNPKNKVNHRHRKSKWTNKSEEITEQTNRDVEKTREQWRKEKEWMLGTYGRKSKRCSLASPSNWNLWMNTTCVSLWVYHKLKTQKLLQKY